MPTSDVTMLDVYLARRRIASIVRRSPLVHSPLLTERVGGSVYLKLESLQETGSFKIRGAANKMLSLTAEEKARGVVTGSSGNHGRAVAYVASQLGVNAVICISVRVPSNKADAIRRFGADTVVYGKSYDESVSHALQLAEERGLTMIDSFDDPFVIAGQGTIGLELLEDWPELDTAIVPLAGGGLLGGIALALKSANPAIRVVGVSMERAPVMYYSLKAGTPIEMEEEETIAHALAGGLGRNNQYTFRMVQEYVDDVVLVSEEAIAEAMVFALEEHHLVVEGAGAVGIAALLHQKVREVGRNVVVVVSGSNVEIPLLLKIAQEHSGKEFT
ncbi:MAG: pyridoxal-phosphate dependent enzyme [Anaerolineae bacterium]